MTKKKVTIYTDGACSGNPGVGGWGAILMYGDAKKELSGAEQLTTNNRMEIMAAIAALKCLNQPCTVELYSDSAYLCNAFNEHWIDRWQRNNWKTSSNKSVENQDLWLELLKLCCAHEVSFHKVKGHADNCFNNRCDELARAAVSKLKAESADCKEDA